MKNKLTCTIDASELKIGFIYGPVYLWKDKDKRKRGTNGKVKHGDTVTVLKRKGDYVWIESAEGKKGWCNYQFIKEFQDN